MTDEETVAQLGSRIAELENDVKVALRHYGAEMLKTQALEARVKELEAENKRLLQLMRPTGVMAMSKHLEITRELKDRIAELEAQLSASKPKEPRP